ncbi:hypothetical protein FDP41_012480 [Naegleria fowleri]|uniref:Uncharacterized protein n=1 Tax=Naegleria fowleri TaxID=5763 RepID=A0A6A5BUS0_NAEFO|nr:uncharacterized protein FDP41_012480 [Naegleria fowleri]KAF0981823.1 hypothetical protein FDP41_012480 [Naegleria fowleri]
MTDDHPSLITKIAHLEKYIEYLESTMNDLTKVINDMIEKQLHEPTSNLKINDNPPNDEGTSISPQSPQGLQTSKLAKDPWVPSERPFILQIVPSSSSSRDEIIKNLNTAKSQTNFKYFISDMSLQITEFTAQHLTGNDENNILHMISCVCNWHEKSKGLIAMRISKPPDSSCFKTTVTVKNLQSLQEILSNTEWSRLKTYTQLAEDSRFEVFINLSTDFEEHEIVNVVKDITTKAGITIHPNSIKIDEKASPFNPEESYYNIIVTLKSDTEVDRILEVVHPIETKHGRIITKSFKSKAQFFKEKAISKSNQSTEKESSNFSTITTPNNYEARFTSLEKRVSNMESNISYIAKNMETLMHSVKRLVQAGKRKDMHDEDIE